MVKVGGRGEKKARFGRTEVKQNSPTQERAIVSREEKMVLRKGQNPHTEVAGRTLQIPPAEKSLPTVKNTTPVAKMKTGRGKERGMRKVGALVEGGPSKFPRVGLFEQGRKKAKASKTLWKTERDEPGQGKKGHMLRTENRSAATTQGKKDGKLPNKRKRRKGGELEPQKGTARDYW